MTGTNEPGPSIRTVARADNWWSSKIPPLLAVGYAAILFHQIEPRTALLGLAVLLLSLSSVATYGHIVNDIFDIALEASYLVDTKPTPHVSIFDTLLPVR